VWGHACHPSYVEGINKDHGPDWHGKKHGILLEKKKKPNAKRAGGVTQLLEHLPCEQEAKFKP
jgi:hypothetical protein